MSVLAAAGWALGTTLVFWLLRLLTLRMRPGGATDLVSHFGCQAIAYLLGLFLILRLHAPDASIRAFLGVRRTHGAFYPLAILLGVTIELPAEALYAAIIRRWPTGAEDDFTRLFHDPATTTPRRVAFAVIIVLLGPVIEEVFFRGALFRPLLKTHPAELVMVATAGLFALVHPEWQTFGPIALVGLSLAFLRWTSGSIFPSMLLHASFNGVSFALMALARPGTPDVPVPGWIVAAAAGLALLLFGGVHLVGARSALAREARVEDRR
jgi:hypothetical protein